MSDIKSELERRLDERMEPIERRLRADYEAAYAQLSEAEKQEPAADVMKRIRQLVALIEAQRDQDRWARLRRLAEVLADSDDMMREALTRTYLAGREAGVKKASDMIDLAMFETYGESWIKSKVDDAVKSYYIDLKHKVEGNGHG